MQATRKRSRGELYQDLKKFSVDVERNVKLFSAQFLFLAYRFSSLRLKFFIVFNGLLEEFTRFKGVNLGLLIGIKICWNILLEAQ